ncbi:MAG: ROK family protein [Alicyclobacillaceae bacterium]|nr:ROK family protein [Alicyclobacillaceae bacterium]MCY0896202.1 ROK family protein [Alicyclobacillaceae bacterium]
MKIGAIEAGGTKFVCGIGDEHGQVAKSITFQTTTPEETLSHVYAFFQSEHIDGLGVGAFGPLELDRQSPLYGHITTTPKRHWQHFNLLGALKDEFSCDIYLDTDVNAAALGEASWGAAAGHQNCIYITVGTGIGAGLLVEGNLVHGLLHPEVGHMLVRRRAGDTFSGCCPYHQDCLEGLASGPAIQARWGEEASLLANNDAVWMLEAYYLGQALTNLILTVSPEKIILGGGVMQQAQLLPLIRREVQTFLAGYVEKRELGQTIDQYIVDPGLGQMAGLKGCLALVVRGSRSHSPASQ